MEEFILGIYILLAFMSVFIGVLLYDAVDMLKQIHSVLWDISVDTENLAGEEEEEDDDEWKSERRS